MKLDPCPPTWATERGLPEPEPDEDYCAYVTRLGYDCNELLDGLTPRTAVLAHIRLTNKIADSLPEMWREHLDEFVKAHRRR